MKYAQILALAFGIVLPIGETYRRWGTNPYLPSLIDDYIIAAFLLLGLWSFRRDPVRGHPVLAAAWGFACAFGYASFFGHLRVIDQPDPGRIPQVWLTTGIGAGWLLGIGALVQTLLWKGRPTPSA